jgi:hypothetical protein
MSSYSTNINGVELEVEYDYTSRVYGDYELPGESAYVDLLAVMVKDSEIDILDIINPALTETIIQEILEYHD